DPGPGGNGPFDESLDGRGLADGGDDEAGRLEPCRRHDIERRGVFALEIVRGGRAGEKVAGRVEQGLGGGSEAQAIVGENHQDSSRRRGDRPESSAQPIGHGGQTLVVGYIAARRWQEEPGGRVPYSMDYPVARSAAELLPLIGFTGSWGSSRT